MDFFNKKEKKTAIGSLAGMNKETLTKVLGGTAAPAPPVDTTPDVQINTSRSNIKS